MNKRIFYLLILFFCLIITFRVAGHVPPELPEGYEALVYIPCDFNQSGDMDVFAGVLRDIWEPHGYRTTREVGQSY